MPECGSSRYSARRPAAPSCRGVRRMPSPGGSRGGAVEGPQPFDPGLGVGFAVDHLGEQVAAGLRHPVPDHHGEVDGGVPGRGLGGGHALVFLLDLALLEEHLVLAPGFGIRGEQQDPGGHAVQPVHGNEVRQVQLVPEPDQRGLLDVGAAGRGGQEVRLVHHEEVLVLVQDVQFHRDPDLRRQGAVVPDEGVVPQRGGAVQGDAGLAHDLAGVEAVLDALRVDVAPAVHHVVHRGVPRPLVREAEAGRVDAVAHGQGGLHHRSILLCRRLRRPSPPPRLRRSEEEKERRKKRERRRREKGRMERWVSERRGEEKGKGRRREMNGGEGVKGRIGSSGRCRECKRKGRCGGDRSWRKRRKMI